MAIITPVRPRWMRREATVVYVANGQMRARSRAEHIHNPRTPRQQRNRERMAVASRFLSQMQAMVSRGFQPQPSPRNGRMVGAYHVAQGELLRSGMRWVDGSGSKGQGHWAIDFPRVRLAVGRSLDGHPIALARRGLRLSIGLPKGHPQGATRIRLAVHAPLAGATYHFERDVPPAGGELHIALPEGAKGLALHLYYTFAAGDRFEWTSGYVAVPKGRSRTAKGGSALAAPSAGTTTGLGHRSLGGVERGRMGAGRPCNAGDRGYNADDRGYAEGRGAALEAMDAVAPEGDVDVWYSSV